MGSVNNMVTKHSWDLDHRIDWNESKIIYKNKKVGERRVVEGALMGLLDTFENNKAFTKEDPTTNFLVCKSLNINLHNSTTAHDAAPTFASPVQVLEGITTTSNTDADADEVLSTDGVISLIEPKPSKN